MAYEKVFPRLLIGAPSSGSGKTLITCALLRILEKKGYEPAGYKCGPDFIDPMFHKRVIGVPSRNLDLFLQGHEGAVISLAKGSENAKIGLIEGVMGYFDGMGAITSEGSSHDLCFRTDTPAIIVVSCKGMSRSVIPIIKGYIDYDLSQGRKTIRGVILNNLSPSIAGDVIAQIEEELNIPVLGYLPPIKKDLFTSRHLGLVMPSEIPGVLSLIDEVADELLKSLDLSKLIEIAKSAGNINISEEVWNKICNTDKKNIAIGVAFDEAFCFYYEDNLDLIRNMGCEIKFFSPLHDEALPDVQGIIIGGGYPELYAQELSENRAMMESVKKAADDGMPILAECGGFLYLKDSLEDMDEEIYPMTGVLNGSGYMVNELNHFGYVDVTAAENNPYLAEGMAIRGHEFHYFDTTDNGEVCNISKPAGGRKWRGIQAKNNVFAGFVHLYYPSCPEFIISFINKILKQEKP